MPFIQYMSYKCQPKNILHIYKVEFQNSVDKNSNLNNKFGKVNLSKQTGY